MKVSGKQILLVVMLATVRGATVNQPSTAVQPDFQSAFKIVENEAAKKPGKPGELGNINYDTFCAAKGQGADKLGCQMKDMPDVGLLVCLVSGMVCQEILKRELICLKHLVDARLKVLQYYDKVINGLKCGEKGSTDVECSGFLVAWISTDQGQGKSLKSDIYKGTIMVLADWVKKYQPNQSARLVTANDLEKIVEFMTPSPGRYNRICDLQGFFMKTGGFVIADPNDLNLDTSLMDTCHASGFPTTEKVIQDLEKMVAELRKKVELSSHYSSKL